jgi:hypothetical protein
MASWNSVDVSVFESYREGEKLSNARYGEEFKRMIKELLAEAERYNTEVTSLSINKLMRVSYPDTDHIDFSKYLKLPDFILTNRGWRNTFIGRKVWFRGKWWEILKDTVHTVHIGRTTKDYLISDGSKKMWITKSELQENGSNLWLVN